MEANYLIYKAESPSGKVYIGLTGRDLELRKKEHLRFAKCLNRKWSFHDALRKYGHSFSWEVIDKTDSLESAVKLEKSYINKFDSFNNGYNDTPGGRGVARFSFTEDQKRELAKKHGAKPFLVFERSSDQFIGRWESVSECARDLNISRSKVSDCLNENVRRYSHSGYYFVSEEL